MNALHDAAMAAKRFHDAALAALDRPDDVAAQKKAIRLGVQARIMLSIALTPGPDDPYAIWPSLREIAP